MKRVLIGAILGVAVGLGIGKMLFGVEKEIVYVDNSRKIQGNYLFLEKFVEKSDYCLLCGEKLYRFEKNVCEYCREWMEGYNKGVEDCRKRYGIGEKNL